MVNTPFVVLLLYIACTLLSESELFYCLYNMVHISTGSRVHGLRSTLRVSVPVASEAV